MTQKNHRLELKKSQIFVALSLLIAAIYSLLYFLAPFPETAITAYHLNIAQHSLIKVTFIIPVVALWGLLTYAARSVHDYASSIKQSEESVGFKRLAYGLYSLLAGSVASSFISLWFSYHAGDSGVRQATTIINNYVGALAALVAFGFIFYGSIQLAKFIKAGVEFEKYTPFVFLVIIFVGSLLVWTIIQNPNRTTSAVSGVRPTYYLNDFLIITTVATPYIVSWALGLTAVINLNLFKARVRGVLYKKAINNFTLGFLLVILLQISLQFLSQSGAYFSQSSLWEVLVAVYVILIGLLVSYLLVASGARELKKIELV